ncbi:hypothetical protein GCM10011348_43720 [Marinobacterium nitratireducens]|uniref:Cyclophilin TM1367-like domain-containing protein n=1 Tax=Marinobacterium nitratireducens TaxID=518897 RepID=A0A917ZR43_9GAMM|nr:cyclophilin-like fold protein [Marinobacterium nitratireducens]GGO88372.1 hypothetical protein GCM10011348_43720 [Marinobacterium nitratireducens]
MTKIRISTDRQSFTAALDESDTAAAILASLPIEGRANVWGDEIYFRTPVSLKAAADARADVEVGDLAYWPPGNAFCIFFGATPASHADEPRAASPVNLFGRIDAAPEELRAIPDGCPIRIEAA